MNRVLFVDDEAPLLDGLRSLLRRQRRVWDMHFALSGAEALELLDKQPFDLIVTDMKMPGMDGPELLNHVKRKYPEVVRVVLSGQAETEQVQRVIPLAHQYLHKPCDAPQLIATVERVLAIRAQVTNRQVRAAVGRFASLPSPGALYDELMRLSSCTTSRSEDFARVIAAEPAMSAKVLQVVNSAFFGLPQPLASISQAVTYLGVDTIKGLALLSQVFAKADSAPMPPEFSCSALQQHSLRAAVLCRAIMTEDARRDEAFAAGLLHDLGMLVLATSMPERFHAAWHAAHVSGVPFFTVENNYLGVSHAAVSAYLLGSWGLPTGIVEAVALHHDTEHVSGVHGELVSALRTAQTVAERTARQPLDHSTVVALLDSLGVHRDRVQPVCDVLVALQSADDVREAVA